MCNKEHFYIPQICQNDSKPRIIFNFQRGHVFVLTVLGDYKAIQPITGSVAGSCPECDLLALKFIKGDLPIRNVIIEGGRNYPHRYYWTGEQLERVKPIPFVEVDE